jgi:TatD DNase family protein
MFFESHAHYDDEAFDIDREELLECLPDNNVKYVVNAGVNISSSKAGIALTQKYNYIYAAVGVHPHDVENMTEDSIDELRDMCKENAKVIAVGEIGLDYYYDRDWADTQKYWFERQLELAREVDLPVIIHSREAAQECFDILKKSNLPKKRAGVIHCYSGSVEMAKQYVDMGFYIGVGGVLTFNNAKKAIEVVEALPLNKILIETDSPYLSPVPNRGKRNNSQNLVYICEKIAQIKQIDVNKVEKITLENARELFHI